MYKIKGKVHKVQKEQKKNFEFATLVINTGAKYDPYPSFQATKERIDTVMALKEGQDVEVEFYVNGREWEGKFFNTLAFKDVHVASGEGTPVQQANTQVPQQEESMDLPF